MFLLIRFLFTDLTQKKDSQLNIQAQHLSRKRITGLAVEDGSKAEVKITKGKTMSINVMKMTDPYSK